MWQHQRRGDGLGHELDVGLLVADLAEVPLGELMDQRPALACWRQPTPNRDARLAVNVAERRIDAGESSQPNDSARPEMSADQASCPWGLATRITQ